MIKATEILIVDINEVIEHPNNPHKHTKDQIKRLTSIIEYQGFRSPLVISNMSGLLIVGHGRLKAAKKLKLKQVPVIYQDFDNADQEYAHMVADNAIGKNNWAELDLSKINVDLQDLGPDFDLDNLGLKDFKLDLNEYANKENKSNNGNNINNSEVCDYCGQEIRHD